MGSAMVHSVLFLLPTLPLFLLYSSDSDGADNDLVLQHDTDDEEDEVEQEHEEAQHFAHAPLTGGDGDNDEEQHDEEEHDGTEQPIAAHLHRLEVVDDVVDQPGEGQPAGRGRTFQRDLLNLIK